MSEQEPANLTWRKSSASESGGCLEVAMSPDTVYVRCSRQRSGPVLQFLPHEWTAFLVGARNGEFDLEIP